MFPRIPLILYASLLSNHDSDKNDYNPIILCGLLGGAGGNSQVLRFPAYPQTAALFLNALLYLVLLSTDFHIDWQEMAQRQCF